ncbi:MAG: tetratricopeptide repeat protein [Ignavibacteriales bacterium]|nr:tetratricopeptide repeat protein [Ignavibacteriales bacterium]
MKKFIRIIFVNIFFVIAAFSQQDQNASMYRLAQAFEQQGEYERALQLYEDLYAKDTNNYPYFDALRRMYVQVKQYGEAIRLSDRRLRTTPFDFTLQANIGTLYAMAGKSVEAESVWNSVLQSSNKNQMFYRAVANEQANQRLFDKAISTYLRGRKDIGDEFVFANELGYLYSFMMDYQNSTREYLKMLKQNELQFDFVQSRLSSIVTRDEGLQAAVKVVDEEVNSRQTIPLLRIQLWLSLEERRYTDAFRVAKKIESLVNSGGVEIFQFAERVFREREYTISAQAYHLALNSGLPVQHKPQAKFGFARCMEELSARGDSAGRSRKEGNISMLETQPTFSGAIDLYAQLAKEFPFSNIGANSLYRIGMIRYKQLFDLDGAMNMFDSVLTISPAGPMIPTVLSTIGDINIAQGKLDDALKRFATMNRSPYSNQEQQSFSQYRLAEIQFFKNDFDSALATLQPLTQNLKADETNDALILQYFITENQFQFRDALKQFARAELLARQFKMSEAVNEFSSIVDLYSAAPLADDALLKKAEYQIQLRQFNQALASYRKLLDDFKLSTEKDKTYFRMGELYQMYLNDKQNAIKSYEVILEKYPFSLFVEEARKRIRMLRGDAS